MCKILAIPSITPETEDNAKKFMRAMAKKMSPGNTDGLGYAAFDGEGNMFGERWLRNYEAFVDRDEVTQFDRYMMENHHDFVYKDEKYNKFGVIKENNWRSAILHTRMATSGRQFINTHPHVYKNTALIHNGIVSVNKSDRLRSTCDSEKILNLYIKHDVVNKIGNIKNVTLSLDGYFACAVLSTMKDGTPILDIFKEEVSNLGAAFIKELGTMVFSTSSSDIKDVCEELKFTIVSFYNVKNNRLIRFNALTGTVIAMRKFKVRETKRKHYGNWPGMMDDWADEGSRRWLDGEYDPMPSTRSITDIVEGPRKGDDNMAQKNQTAVLRLANSSEEHDGWQYNSNTKVWYKETK